MDVDLSRDNPIKLLRGKYKGRTGYIITQTTNHHLSSKKRYAVRVQTGIGWKTVLMHRDGFTLTK